MAKVTYLGSNDGDGLDGADSVTLADALDEASASGHLDAYAARRSAAIAALPRVTCEQCDGTGTRTDEVGQRMGFATRDWCNGCDDITIGDIHFGAGTRLEIAAANGFMTIHLRRGDCQFDTWGHDHALAGNTQFYVPPGIPMTFNISNAYLSTCSFSENAFCRLTEDLYGDD